MALKIPVPSSAWSSVNVSLAGIEYTITYSYNERNQRWAFALTLEGNKFLNSTLVIEQSDLTGRFLLEQFDHGAIFCVRLKNDDMPAGRNNVGLGKSYELVYLTNEEIEQE